MMEWTRSNMKINILTLFPEMFSGFKSESIIGKALEKNLLEINNVNIRDFVMININKLMICLLVEELEWL